MEVWPENHAAFILFHDLFTQWRVGMSGPTGLDYAAMYPLLDRRAQSQQEWDQLFEDLQLMEAAALKQMRENSSNN